MTNETDEKQGVSGNGSVGSDDAKPAQENEKGGNAKSSNGPPGAKKAQGGTKRGRKQADDTGLNPLAVKREIKLRLISGCISATTQTRPQWIADRISEMAGEIIDIAGEHFGEQKKLEGAIEIAGVIADSSGYFLFEAGRLTQSANVAAELILRVDGKKVEETVAEEAPKAEKPEPKKKEEPEDAYSVPDDPRDIELRRIGFMGPIAEKFLDLELFTIGELLEFDTAKGLFTVFGEGMAGEILETANAYLGEESE